MWYTYTVEYYCTIKRKETGSFVVMWVDLEPVIWNELSQEEKKQIQNDGTHELVSRQELEA